LAAGAHVNLISEDEQRAKTEILGPNAVAFGFDSFGIRIAHNAARADNYGKARPAIFRNATPVANYVESIGSKIDEQRVTAAVKLVLDELSKDVTCIVSLHELFDDACANTCAALTAKVRRHPVCGALIPAGAANLPRRPSPGGKPTFWNSCHQFPPTEHSPRLPSLTLTYFPYNVS
jgi:hypothetical protein